jgi:D-serine deaminase-like pyridoxal phosphate-dependent protein
MIVINIGKAKNITHDLRRAARAEEFKPHDEVIMKQIPGVDAAAAEAARQAIRDKYAALQVSIDSVQSIDNLKQIVESLKSE